MSMLHRSAACAGVTALPAFIAVHGLQAYPSTTQGLDKLHCVIAVAAAHLQQPQGAPSCHLCRRCRMCSTHKFSHKNDHITIQL